MKSVEMVAAAVLAAVALGGCKTSYVWTSGVPEGMRTVAVPTFRNETDVTEFGSVAAREVLREFQREGTFGIRRSDDAALEVQGVLRSVDGSRAGYASRRSNYRTHAGELRVTAAVSVVDRRAGKVLVDNRVYTATAPYESSQDYMTAKRNASGRVAEDLARQIVDDVLAIPYANGAGKE